MTAVPRRFSTRDDFAQASIDFNEALDRAIDSALELLHYAAEVRAKKCGPMEGEVLPAQEPWCNAIDMIMKLRESFESDGPLS